MANELTFPIFTHQALTTVQDKVERYADGREAADIFKEGTRHIVAQQMQAAKTQAAVNLTTDLYDHTLKTADRFARQAFARTEANGHNDESRAFSQSVTGSLMARYNSHIHGILEVGVTGIARELHKDVNLPKPEKRGWFR